MVRSDILCFSNNLPLELTPPCCPPPTAQQESPERGCLLIELYPRRPSGARSAGSGSGAEKSSHSLKRPESQLTFHPGGTGRKNRFRIDPNPALWNQSEMLYVTLSKDNKHKHTPPGSSIKGHIFKLLLCFFGNLSSSSNITSTCTHLYPGCACQLRKFEGWTKAETSNCSTRLQLWCHFWCEGETASVNMPGGWKLGTSLKKTSPHLRTVLKWNQLKRKWLKKQQTSVIFCELANHLSLPTS